MKHPGDPLIYLGFALIALAWPFLNNLDPSDIWNSKPSVIQADPTPTPTPSLDPRVAKVLEFCMDDRHANSVICTVENPNSVEDLLPLAEHSSRTRVIETGSGGESGKDTQIVERTHTVRTESPVTKEPEPQEPEEPISIPEIPEIDVPEVEVPEIDLPVVGNTGNLTNDVIAADSDD